MTPQVLGNVLRFFRETLFETLLTRCLINSQGKIIYQYQYQVLGQSIDYMYI